MPLRELAVVEDGWRERHRKTLRAAYGMAPFFEHVMPEWEAVLDTRGSVADVAVASLRFTHRWLRSPADLVRASELPGAPAALADVARAAEGIALLTLPESAERDRAALPDLEVRVLAFEERPRRQLGGGFVPGLGVLDLLMTHGPAAADVLRASIG